MTRTAPGSRRPTPVELTADHEFQKRIRRLAAVSLIALGIIAALAGLAADASTPVLAMLEAGWILMPTILAASLVLPRLRYLLIFPALLVFLGLAATTLGFKGSATARTGWWLVTAGVAMGGVMGGWLWFRWMSVPRTMEDPFSPARWSLVTVHVALIVAGVTLVTVDAAL